MKKKIIINLIFLVIFVSILNIMSASALCNTNSDCDAASNGYCDILGKCHYCDEGKYYSLGYAKCVECVSDSECTSGGANGVCGILNDCFYCDDDTPYYDKYSDKCVECIENSDCNKQSNGYCNILGECHYCPEEEYYSLGYAKCVECVSDSECNKEPNGVCGILQDCFYCKSDTPYYDKYSDKCVKESPPLDEIKPIINNVKTNDENGYVKNELTFTIDYSELNPDYISLLCYYDILDVSKYYSYRDNTLESGNNKIWMHTIDLSDRLNNSKIDYCQILFYDKAGNYDTWVNSNDYIIKKDIVTENSIEENEQETEEDTQETGESEEDGVETQCDGCKLNNKCYPVNNRKSGKYCSVDKIWVEQKEKNKNCENNFECKSNVCVGGECLSQSLLQRIIEFFKRLFGGGHVGSVICVSYCCCNPSECEDTYGVVGSGIVEAYLRHESFSNDEIIEKFLSENPTECWEESHSPGEREGQEITVTIFSQRIDPQQGVVLNQQKLILTIQNAFTENEYISKYKLGVDNCEY